MSLIKTFFKSVSREVFKNLNSSLIVVATLVYIFLPFVVEIKGKFYESVYVDNRTQLFVILAIVLNEYYKTEKKTKQ